MMNTVDCAKTHDDQTLASMPYIGTQNLNSDIAMNFRKNLIEGKIDFLVNFRN